ncbi:MAG TPA: hypothetical protein VF600_01570 [Abditibacteriaceae bacterium]|jgi:hypothetical protein
MNEPKQNYPLWETIVMAASFALLWAWFLARQSATRTGTDLWPGWTALQFLALAALVLVLVRRMIRVRDAMRENTKLPNQRQFPFMGGPMNGNGAPHNGAPHNGAPHNGAPHNGNGHNGTPQKRKRK